MSHPLIVEAAETLFVPLCVYNNTSGDQDAQTRDSFDEPAWNNPVVRVITSDRRELAPRNANGWTIAALAEGMVAGLQQHGTAVPAWLRLLAHEQAALARGVDTAIFGMT